MQKTFTAFTIVDNEATAYALSEHLEECDPAPTGVGTFEIEDGSGLWEIGAYFTKEPDDTSLKLLAELYNAKPFKVSEVEDTDWVAQVQRELTPVTADKFFVYGQHDADKLPKTSIGIKIEAAVAFGTGHHGTTKGCLLAMQSLARTGFKPDRVADVGCGTGILAIGAAKLWRCPVLATDMDPIAVKTANENIEANSVQPYVKTRVAMGTQHPLYRQQTFDLVVANILAKPLKALAPDVRRCLAPEGYVILSGILLRQGADVIQMYRSWNMHLVEKFELEGWGTYLLQAH
jgi:ribosomal protein L11 methyltransferase